MLACHLILNNKIILILSFHKKRKDAFPKSAHIRVLKKDHIKSHKNIGNSWVCNIVYILEVKFISNISIQSVVVYLPTPYLWIQCYYITTRTSSPEKHSWLIVWCLVDTFYAVVLHYERRDHSISPLLETSVSGIFENGKINWLYINQMSGRLWWLLVEDKVFL